MMGSLLKKISSHLKQARSSVANDRMLVAAFGKHPAWDDHIDDISLSTELLVSAKRLLYVQGIGENIDSGAWEKLQDKDQAIEFKHAFMWYHQGDLLVGRLSASRDGRGRTRYPMVLCAHCGGLPLERVGQHVLSELSAAEQHCAAAATQAAVQRIISQTQEKLCAWVSTSDRPKHVVPAISQVLAQLSRLPELASHEEGLLRILYHIEREVGDMQQCSSQALVQHPVHIRAPLETEYSDERSHLWLDFFLALFGRQTSVALFLPQDREWIDIVAVEPTPAHLYALRALAQAIPLTHTIPYTINEEFKGRIKKMSEGTT